MNTNSKTDVQLDDTEKIKILHNFADELLSGSEDVDPEIMKLVNENFWDLI